MEQQHVRTTALPTSEPGDSARPYVRLAPHQVKAINSCLDEINSLVFVMAKFGDNHVDEGDGELLNCCRVVERVIRDIQSELEAGQEVRHD